MIAAAVGIVATSAVGFAVVVLTKSNQCGLPGEGGCPMSPEALASLRAEAERARLAALGGPPPSNCGDQPVPVHPDVPGTIWDSTASQGSFPAGISIGKEPVWLQTGAMRLEDGKAVLHLVNEPRSKTADGFPIRLTWITDAAFTGTVNVRLVDRSTGRDTRIRAASTAPPLMHDPTVLDPSEGRGPVTNGNTPPYRLFYVTAYVHSPGCYLAEASWQSSNWTVGIAMGQ